MKEKVCVIVDGFSTTRLLPEALAAKNIGSVHVFSSPELPERFMRTFDRDMYRDTVTYNGDIDDIMDLLSQYEIVGSVTGIDTGVYLADQIAAGAGCPGNNSCTSAARRNKCAMVKKMEENKVPFIPAYEAEDASGLTDWALRNKCFPLIVKPLESAGTDGIRICSCLSELESAVKKIIGRKNALGAFNASVMGQKFIDGVEYIVNTVSVGGTHFVTDAWHCLKPKMGQSKIYDLEELISPSSDIVQDKLLPYLYSVLDALDVKNGPVHSELIMDANGPLLIEMAPRLQGSINPDAILTCTGASHMSALADSIADPDGFVEKSIKQPFYEPFKTSFCVSLFSQSSGILVDLPKLDDIRNLPSFFSISMMCNVGDPITPTTDLFSTPGIVYLVHENRDQLVKDYHAIRTMEKDNFFVLN